MTRVRRILRVHWFPALIAAVVGGIAFPIFDKTPPMEFTGHHVDNPVVERGGTLRITWYQDWSYGCSGTSTRTMLDRDHVYHSVRGVDITPPPKMGKRTSPTTEILVPRNTPPGETELWTTIDFKCGPTGKRFDVRSQTVYFVVK